VEFSANSSVILIVFCTLCTGSQKVDVVLHSNATILVALMSNIHINKLPKKMLQLTLLHGLTGMEKLLMV
jgi:hypothetical protein